MTTSASFPRSGMTDRHDRDTAMSALLARNWWAIALRGVVAIIFGLIALFVPGATLLSLALFFGAYLIVDGIFGCIAAIRAASRHERWGLLLAEGLLDILVGIAAALFPVGAVLAFVLLTAAWSLVTGALMIGAAFRLNPAYGRGWLIFSGIVSVLFGIALVVAPLIGAVVLTWWLGAYAIAFGIALLAVAFKLRGHKDDLMHPTGTAMPRGA